MKVWMPPDPSPEEQHRAGVLLRDGMNCCLARLGPCHGEVQAHHVVPRQRMKKVMDGDPLEYAIADSRNGVMLCEKHHSQPGDLVATDLPPEIVDFGEQYALRWSLDRDFGPREMERLAGEKVASYGTSVAGPDDTGHDLSIELGWSD